MGRVKNRIVEQNAYDNHSRGKLGMAKFLTDLHYIFCTKPWTELRLIFVIHSLPEELQTFFSQKREDKKKVSKKKVFYFFIEW